MCTPTSKFDPDGSMHVLSFQCVKPKNGAQPTQSLEDLRFVQSRSYYVIAGFAVYTVL